MDTLLFNRTQDKIDIFLIVDNVSICKLDNVKFKVGGFTNFNPKYLKANNYYIKGTFTTSNLDAANYQDSMTSMIIINNKEEKHDYNIILFRVVISDIDGDTITTLKGNTCYSYIAEALRIIDTGGKDE